MSEIHLPQVKDEAGFSRFLKAMDAELEKAAFGKTGIEWAKKWNEPYDAGLQAKIDRVHDAIYTEKNHETVAHWGSRVDDPLLKRWAEVLDWQFKFQLIEQNPELRSINNRVSDRYMTWRPQIDGEEISFARHTTILRDEPDRGLREKAWHAMWKLHEEIADITRTMFELRNEGAAKWGYPTYADLRLAGDGVNREWLLDFVNQMETASEKQYWDHLGTAAEQKGYGAVEPWDIRYLFESVWPDHSYFPGTGINDSVDKLARSLGLKPAELGIRLYAFDSPYGGQCMKYGPGDARILTGYGDSMQAYKTAYHEYGHALHATFSEPSFSLRNESDMFDEGIAECLAMFLYYPSWLRRHGLPEEEIKRYQENRRLLLMYRDRSICSDSVAELQVWDDPAADSTEIFGAVTARLMGGQKHPRPFAAVPRWTQPMCMHSYFIADAISSQTHAYLRKEFGSVFDNEAPMRSLIDQYLRPGATIPWLDKIRNLTGEDFKFEYLGQQLTEPFPEA